jgi:delta-aminolevulinic acid dehydratase/porphobilinogen synthase
LLSRHSRFGRETTVNPKDFILPLFVSEKLKKKLLLRACRVFANLTLMKLCASGE